ncbi:hypothetical protein [Alienimonas sp. DA493]|uniref:hypothetical protein n=1 Tax=Alienimonas sp. DA493 TaxID=3373605 RepID=UPI00375523A4
MYDHQTERPYDFSLSPAKHLENWEKANGTVHEQEGETFYAPNGAQCCPFASGVTMDFTCGLDTVPGQPWINRVKYAELKRDRLKLDFDDFKNHLLNGTIFEGRDADLAKLKAMQQEVRRAAEAVEAAERERREHDPLKRQEDRRALWEIQRDEERAEFQNLVNSVQV